jgi:DNA-binding response OmpR family regulator
MGPALKPAKKKLPATPRGHLPLQMRILFITGPHRTGGWLAEAFAADSASEVQLEEVIGVAAGVARLRDEVFDAVLISHEGEDLDALELLDAIRAGSSDEQPIVVLGEQSEQEMAALCFEADGDAYVCVNTTTTRTLIWQVARAMERHEMIAENRRLQQSQQHRLQLEHEEATRLLQQQRAMIVDLERVRLAQDTAGGNAERACSSEDLTGCPDLPKALVEHYRELLRAYVIMGSGNLSEEMNRLAGLLASAAVTSQQAMLLHLHVLEDLVRGLGSRSARHVMNRADMLVLEVMINLAQNYRERFLKRVHPPRQRMLPGFGDTASRAFGG